MSIRKHILSSLFVVLALTFISFGTSIYYLQRIGSTSTQILQEDYQTVKAAEELIISLAKVDRALFMLCLDSTAAEEEVLQKVIRSERAVIASYLTVIQSNTKSSTDSLYQTLEASYQQYERNLDQVATVSDRGEFYLSLLRWQNEVFQSNCSKIVDHSHRLLKAKNESLQNLYLKAKINTFLASILVLLIVGVVLDKIPDRIIRPISELTDKVKQLVQREEITTEKEVELTTDTDLKELASSINLAGQKLKETEEKFWLIT
ncbi:MAG: MCP four helix bundle domain-containing protein, partial [Bacteroidota bacterium]